MPSSAWRSTLFPYTTLFRSDRKSTRLNSSHDQISYAVFCLKKKKTCIPPSGSDNYSSHLLVLSDALGRSRLGNGIQAHHTHQVHVYAQIDGLVTVVDRSCSS